MEMDMEMDMIPDFKQNFDVIEALTIEEIESALLNLTYELHACEEKYECLDMAILMGQLKYRLYLTTDKDYFEKFMKNLFMFSQTQEHHHAEGACVH